MEKALLFKKDEELFDRMAHNYISNNEKMFFETQRYKQEYVPTGMNDLVLSENSNVEGIYIVREGYGEYLIGRIQNETVIKEFHVMNLCDALSINIRDLGCGSENMTLFQWLRARDYQDVMYDHNYDNLE